MSAALLTRGRSRVCAGTSPAKLSREPSHFERLAHLSPDQLTRGLRWLRRIGSGACAGRSRVYQLVSPMRGRGDNNRRPLGGAGDAQTPVAAKKPLLPSARHAGRGIFGLVRQHDLAAGSQRHPRRSQLCRGGDVGLSGRKALGGVNCDAQPAWIEKSAGGAQRGS